MAALYPFIENEFINVLQHQSCSLSARGRCDESAIRAGAERSFYIPRAKFTIPFDLLSFKGRSAWPSTMLWGLLLRLYTSGSNGTKQTHAQ
jgi:hypothetical protein